MLIFFALFIVCTFIFFHASQQKQNKQINSITIGFAGDVMIGRLVNEIIIQKGHLYPWGNMLETVQSVDISIINLETTLTNSEKKVPKVFNFKSKPEHVSVLEAANITVVNLANNHSLDFNTEGLRETLDVLDKAHIQHAGAGMNNQEAEKPVIIEKNGIKIGIIGFTDNEPGWKAGPEKPGVTYIKIGDLQSAEKIITPLRNTVDILIVSAHWGPNMKERPSKQFVQFAHQLVDLGVDIFHGHSAHLVQGIEIYNKKLIMYDTGDFIDDYMVDETARNDLSFFFEIKVEKNQIKTVTLIPAAVSNMQVNHATGKDRQFITDRMKQLSSEFGTQCSANHRGLHILISN